MSPRTFAKRLIFTGARYVGLNALARHTARRRLLVLCYHGVVSDDRFADRVRGRNIVSQRVFRVQLEILARRFTPVSAHDVYDFAERKAELPPNPVLVTFDDGFRNNLTNAMPELERLGIPAIVHVATGLISSSEMLWTQELDERVLAWRHPTIPLPGGQPDVAVPESASARGRLADRIRAVCKTITNDERLAYFNELRMDSPPQLQDWQHELYDFMTWDEVRLLSRKNAAIGSHTVSHPILTRLNPKQLATELTDSKQKIERELGQPCPWIAYPNGGPADYSASVIAAAREAGFKVGFTLAEGLNPERPEPLEIRRFCIGANMTHDAFQARVSGLQEFKKLVRR